jgi:hypothetical protein
MAWEVAAWDLVEAPTRLFCSSFLLWSSSTFAVTQAAKAISITAASMYERAMAGDEFSGRSD